MRRTEAYPISQDCPECGEEIAMLVDYEAHPATPASADYPGEPAHIDVWQVEAPAQCPHCGARVTFDGLDATAAEIIDADLRESTR